MPGHRPVSEADRRHGNKLPAPGMAVDGKAGIHLVIRVNLVQAACRNRPGAL
jgi:hypothetical protein